MSKIGFFLLFFYISFSFAQQSDFKHIDFSKADYIAKTVKTKRLYELNKLTFKLTKDLETDVEKVRAGVITSEPLGKLNASTPMKRAEDPELT